MYKHITLETWDCRAHPAHIPGKPNRALCQSQWHGQSTKIIVVAMHINVVAIYINITTVDIKAFGNTH